MIDWTEEERSRFVALVASGAGWPQIAALALELAGAREIPQLIGDGPVLGTCVEWVRASVEADAAERPPESAAVLRKAWEAISRAAIVHGARAATAQAELKKCTSLLDVAYEYLGWREAADVPNYHIGWPERWERLRVADREKVRASKARLLEEQVESLKAEVTHLRAALLSPTREWGP